MDAIAAVAARLAGLAPARLGVAVSGGSDSTALLLAAADWARAAPGRTLAAASVDHRLRAEAAAECAGVARLCARLGAPHETLRWEDAPGRGNLPAAARAARTRLLADWAARRGLGAVALGHTMDDQAETVLMRLGRGAGTEGLSAMRERSERAGTVWLRPALGVGREALREALRARGVGWVEDPSNADPARDRVRARTALAALAPLGITAEGLAETAARLAAEDDLLRALAADLLARAARIGAAGEVILDRALWRAAAPELRRRALRRLLTELTGAEHGPRHDALMALEATLSGRGPVAPRTLHGAVAEADAAAIRLWGEPAAGLPPRWRLRWTGGPAEGLEAGVLGEDGLAELSRAIARGDWSAPPGWAAAPRGARAASPALRRAGRLAAAPLARFGPATAEDALAAVIAPEGRALAR